MDTSLRMTAETGSVTICGFCSGNKDCNLKEKIHRIWTFKIFIRKYVKNQKLIVLKNK